MEIFIRRIPLSYCMKLANVDCSLLRKENPFRFEERQDPLEYHVTMTPYADLAYEIVNMQHMFLMLLEMENKDGSLKGSKRELFEELNETLFRNYMERTEFTSLDGREDFKYTLVPPISEENSQIELIQNLLKPRSLLRVVPDERLSGFYCSDGVGLDRVLGVDAIERDVTAIAGHLSDIQEILSGYHVFLGSGLMLDHDLPDLRRTVMEYLGSFGAVETKYPFASVTLYSHDGKPISNEALGNGKPANGLASIIGTDEAVLIQQTRELMDDARAILAPYTDLSTPQARALHRGVANLPLRRMLTEADKLLETSSTPAGADSFYNPVAKANTRAA